MIIADIDSKEKSLISKVNQDPRTWNSASLNVDLKTNSPDVSTAVRLAITLTKVTSDVSRQIEVGRSNAQKPQPSKQIQANISSGERNKNVTLKKRAEISTDSRTIVNQCKCRVK